MEQRIKCALPAPTDASEPLIDLVDRVMKRHPGKAKLRRKLFSFLMRDRPLVRPSLDRPSQKIDWVSAPNATLCLPGSLCRLNYGDTDVRLRHRDVGMPCGKPACGPI